LYLAFCNGVLNYEITDDGSKTEMYWELIYIFKNNVLNVLHDRACINNSLIPINVLNIKIIYIGM